jgi:hypothetical protein
VGSGGATSVATGGSVPAPLGTGGTSGTMSGTIGIKVSPSRTSCAAPCAVFFDATGTTGLANNDYVAGNFNWNFDSTGVDPNGKHRTTIGFVTAHVFQSPGTYQVAVSARDSAGNSGAATLAITVTTMNGPVFYVSAGGNDSNAGTSTSAPFATLATALTHASANSQILLRRGDTFQLGTVTVNIPSNASSSLIGAYTDSAAPSTAAPILNSTIPTVGWGSIFEVRNVTDVRFADLHLVASAGAFQGAFINNTTNILFLRVDMEGVGMPASTGTMNFQLGSAADGTYLVDSHMHDFAGYGVYGDRPTHFAVIGTTIERFSGQDHGIRIQGGNDQTVGFANCSYVADNLIAPNTAPTASFDATAFRGDDTNIVEVNNDFRRVISFTPQNLERVEHISNVLVEGNIISDVESPANGGAVGISIRASHVVVRNNIIVNPGTAVDVQGHPLLPANWVDQISIYNNTVYVQQQTGVATNSVVHFLQHLGTTGNVTLQNNIYSEAMTSASSCYVTSDGSGTETENHNLGYAPNVASTWTGAPHGTGDIVGNPTFITLVPAVGSDYAIQQSSPALNTGISTSALLNYLGAARSTFNMGAF